MESILKKELLLGFLGTFIDGGGKVNKTTKVIDADTYQLIISTIRTGFEHKGVKHKSNERIATILVLEYNLGIRLSDVLNLTMRSFVAERGRIRLDIYEKKTGKYRNFIVPDEVYNFVRDYAYENSINPQAKLFPVSERAVLKHLELVCDYLDLEGIGTHSFRKAFATNIYVNSGYNVELVRRLLQHSSSAVTTRYIGIGSQELEEALQKNVYLC